MLSTIGSARESAPENRRNRPLRIENSPTSANSSHPPSHPDAAHNRGEYVSSTMSNSRRRRIIFLDRRHPENPRQESHDDAHTNEYAHGERSQEVPPGGQFPVQKSEGRRGRRHLLRAPGLRLRRRRLRRRGGRIAVSPFRLMTRGRRGGRPGEVVVLAQDVVHLVVHAEESCNEARSPTRSAAVISAAAVGGRRIPPGAAPRRRRRVDIIVRVVVVRPPLLGILGLVSPTAT
mmetsp:Transcript_26622/g.56639  ORF Transcript_26622/g.56639 Transcript_26622/m.56639 type:complete len:233 (-) Transcript_26622:33-731(-)